jgi:Predicted membrane protein (DUF2254)
MISLIATVLAITMVVVQLTMAQFSPRIVQTFLEDKPSQNAIGLFVATFVRAILTMREVLVSEDEPVIPGLSVLVVFVMVLVDIVVLVVYVHHIGRALRVSALIELVGKNTRALMDDMYPDRLDDEQHQDPHVVTARKSGVLSIIGYDHLVEIARLAGARARRSHRERARRAGAGCRRGGSADLAARASSRHEPHEQLVNPGVASDLGVERGGQPGALSHRHDSSRSRALLDPSEHLHAWADLLDPRSPDEDGSHRRPADRPDVQVLLEGVDLSAECVAPDRDVKSAEGLLVRPPVGDPLGKHDHPGARAVGRHACGQPLAQRFVEVEGAHEFVHGRGLAAGDDQRVDRFQLRGSAHGGGAGTRPLQGIQVLAHVPLDGEDTNGWLGGHDRNATAAPPSLRHRLQTK